MAEELKVPSLEERLANVLAHRGQVRFNRQTVVILIWPRLII